jgi:hexosaminidase
MFHAVTTIGQLLPVWIERKDKDSRSYHHVVSVPCVDIYDYSRFVYHGFMLDTERNFSAVSSVKRYIDLLSLHKMSVFHFHLTKDESWRIEIKKYRKLSEMGAWRGVAKGKVNTEEEEEEGFVRFDNGKNNEYTRNVKYGGFYTHEDMKEIVSFGE